jgi:hypothetical protein
VTRRLPEIGLLCPPDDLFTKSSVGGLAMPLLFRRFRRPRAEEEAGTRPEEGSASEPDDPAGPDSGASSSSEDLAPESSSPESSQSRGSVPDPALEPVSAPPVVENVPATPASPARPAPAAPPPAAPPPRPPPPPAGSIPPGPPPPPLPALDESVASAPMDAEAPASCFLCGSRLEDGYCPVCKMNWIE